MGWLKRVEWLAKHLLAVLSAALLWRPGRARRGLAPKRLERLLLMRIDNRVGEALLTTPLISAARRAFPHARIDVLVHGRARRVLEGHPAASSVQGLDRRRLFLGPWAPGIRSLRARAYDVVVNAANWEVPSITSAIVARLVARDGVVVGPSMWPVRWLTDVPVPPRPGTVSELAQRLHLLSPLGIAPPHEPLSFRPVQLSPALQALVAQARATPSAVVNPGGRLDWRRIPVEVFAACAQVLLQEGRRVIVTWGPGEEPLARGLVAQAPGAQLAPPTNIDELAGLMAACELTVCNNTGPMHLAVAVGAPTLAFFLRMSVERWGHGAAPHRMVDLTAWQNDLAQMRAQAEAATRQMLTAPVAAVR